MSLDGAGAHFELQMFDYFPDKYATGVQLLLLIPSDQCVRLSNSSLTYTIFLQLIPDFTLSTTLLLMQ